MDKQRITHTYTHLLGIYANIYSEHVWHCVMQFHCEIYELVKMKDKVPVKMVEHGDMLYSSGLINSRLPLVARQHSNTTATQLLDGLCCRCDFGMEPCRKVPPPNWLVGFSHWGALVAFNLELHYC